MEFIEELSRLINELKKKLGCVSNCLECQRNYDSKCRALIFLLNALDLLKDSEQ